MLLLFFFKNSQMHIGIKKDIRIYGKISGYMKSNGYQSFHIRIRYPNYPDISHLIYYPDPNPKSRYDSYIWKKLFNRIISLFESSNALIISVLFTPLARRIGNDSTRLCCYLFIIVVVIVFYIFPSRFYGRSLRG